ncbi:sperm nuclear basic protein PL-I isoform PLIb [Rhodotorula diobovata]|uniref:Sperm nuclear basic protein PL-I isoform PLIb n=1 Tax=Rhodotorula diobovata TaxID=5288 RepID=A0A5C5FRA4_9BASI|nr:sperm nuclear basic protein PL-I isoform PLIb [Rhodotorula diobovata]
MPPKPATKSAYGRAKETVEMSFVDLVWMLQEVPLGTPNALPALGSPLPWYILPAPLAKTKCPWTRAPNDKSRRLESIHREAARGMRQLEQAKRDARDPAEVRAEANRKKKARKLASKARREAEGGDAASAAAEAPAAKADAKRTPTAPKCAYALPPYISGETQAAFIEQYARVHATWDQQRWDEAEVVMPAHLKKQAVWGNAYIYPSEHSPEDPQRGLVLNPDTLTFEYHTE